MKKNYKRTSEILFVLLVIMMLLYTFQTSQHNNKIESYDRLCDEHWETQIESCMDQCACLNYHKHFILNDKMDIEVVE